MRISLCLLLFTILVIGCSPGLMVYNTVNTPSFTNKGQAKINLFTNLTHAELQFAYSPKERIGLFANSYYEFANVGSKGTYLAEGACGYYSDLENTNWHFDVFGGLGLGSRKYQGGWNNFFLYNHDDNGINTYYSSFYAKFFAQSSLYYRSDRTEVAFTLQPGIFYFSSYNLRMDTFFYAGHFSSSTYQLNRIPVINLNPAFTYKYLWNHFGFVFQLASNIELTNPTFTGVKNSIKVYNYTGPTSLNFTSRPIALNVGVQIQF